MEFSGYYNSGKLLKEGKCYSFKYIKCVTLEDNNQYMILEDLFGIRHFIEYQPYKAYNLEVSDDIQCLVAKINCTGRIYLEPDHPVYKVGMSYLFNIISVMEQPGGYQFTVNDCFKNEIVLNIEGNLHHLPKVGESISARVESIKKGTPTLELDKLTLLHQG